MNAPDPGEDFTGHTEIELLRVIAERQGQTNALLAQLIEAVDALSDGEVTAAGTLEHVDGTLTTFLQDWLEENTSPPDPAVAVTLTWREPQAPPKGP